MTPDAVFDVIEATWPAARLVPLGPWVVRDGKGGGKRVSAATPTAEVKPSDIPEAEEAMRGMGQQPLFMIRPGDEALDAALQARGYRSLDPTTAYSLPITRLTDVPVPRVTAFCIWEPLAIMEEIWAPGGIGPERVAVMARAEVKTGILARWNEKPAGAAFAALHQKTCMVHAVEILPDQRRQGVAGWVMRAAAFWAQNQGAEHISVLCTQANTAANRLYSSLGFAPVGQYHYRYKDAQEVQ